MNVGFIGIGQMGRHMSRHIFEAGYDLTVHDANKEAAVPLVELGAAWADSPRDVARSCDVVISSLPTPAIVEEVVYGENGLLSGWKPGDIFVDMSTNSPSFIQRIANDAADRGVTVLDAPVSGGTVGAEKGTLAIMVGGDFSALEKVRKILETMGSNIVTVGEVGCGNIAKLVNNYISLTTNAVTAEGFVLGVKAGIDPQVLFDIIRVSTGACWSLEQMPDTVFKANFEPGFKMSLGRKDMGLALAMGNENGVPLPIGELVQQGLDEAIDAGLAEKSVQAVILPMEEQTGVQVRTTNT
ncbi:MAG: NAD(P)-dependent oxidoreductase [Dehalococcoidales bacterium]|nr:NAD(P)-dependent oxidoreductase [Dehalococcoidales bacterium]